MEAGATKWRDSLRNIENGNAASEDEVAFPKTVPSKIGSAYSQKAAPDQGYKADNHGFQFCNPRYPPSCIRFQICNRSAA